MTQLILNLLIIAMLCPLARGDEEDGFGLFPKEGLETPMARQEMWDLNHQYRDPQSGVLRYEIRATYATSRVEKEGTFFDVEKPEMEYYGKETMWLGSSKGIIDIRREKILLQGEVIGYMDSLKKSQFTTREVEMDFHGRGKSDHPIRLSQPGALIEGTHSEILRDAAAPDSAKDETDRGFQVKVYGPGRARLERASPSAWPEGAPRSVGSRFVVLFRGSAFYSQSNPSVLFSSLPDDPSDRVTLYGDGYILKSRDLKVYPAADGKTWERVDAQGDITYETSEGLSPDTAESLHGLSPESREGARN